jgi:dephospho-CoA kinase
MPLGSKRGLATYVVENDADLPALRERLDRVWSQIEAGRKPRGRR